MKAYTRIKSATYFAVRIAVLFFALLGFVLSVVVGLFFYAGSNTAHRNPEMPVSVELNGIVGIPNARYWADKPPVNLEEMVRLVAEQRAKSGTKSVSALAISGGSDYGAYGAGVLTAWTQNGNRPEFTIVTGVSTGALTAPFAFLGPEWDGELSKIYGGIPRQGIIRVRNPFEMVRTASVVNVQPLKDVIESYTTEEFLSAIAREHTKGRRLYVQSTHLDAQRPVIWDLGAIASSGAPNALEVFRKALMASAAFPGAFEPVIFGTDLVAGPRDEMHVDGGVVSQITLVHGWQPELHNITQKSEGNARLDEVFVILNGRIKPEASVTQIEIGSIVGRLITTITKGQYIEDLEIARRAFGERGVSFNATWIGEDFDQPYPGPFDTEFMSALFDYGYQRVLNNKAWEN